MFDNLGKSLTGVFKNLRGHGKISEANIREAMREVRMALLKADVNFKVVKEFVDSVTEKSMGEEVYSSISPSQHIVGVVHRELIELLGGEAADFSLNRGSTNTLLLLGLQGSGKTTFAGKLAHRLKTQGWKPLLVACDIYRPAAIKQLHVVGDQVGVKTFDLGTDKTPSEIVAQARKQAARDGNDLLIVDTAGRLHIDEVKMDELIALKKSADPNFTFLVADSMTGQDAVNSAQKFNESVGIDGVCLTKLDGDAQGGAALSIRKVTGKKIFFVGVGEKADDLEPFYPDRMASRILGMGDVVSLFEKAVENYDEENALKMQEKFKRQTFTLQDFLDQMQQVRKMGPLKKILEMIPGVKQAMGDREIDEKEFKRIEAMILSMTPEERENPAILNGQRKKRVAMGSGMQPQDVNALLTQFEQSKKMMKMLMGGKKPMMPGMPGSRGSAAGTGKHRTALPKQQQKKKRKPRPKRHK